MNCTADQGLWLGSYELSVKIEPHIRTLSERCQGKMATVYGVFVSGAGRQRSREYFVYPYDIDSVVHVECCYVDTDTRTKISL